MMRTKSVSARSLLLLAAILAVGVVLFAPGGMKAYAADVTLSGDENYTAQDGDVLTGSTSGTVRIADKASITLSDVTIGSGIICEGTATIALSGENSVVGCDVYDWDTNTPLFTAGIQVGGAGTTLTIKGDGSLRAQGGPECPGIGLSQSWGSIIGEDGVIDEDGLIGGDIVIEGGNVTAIGDPVSSVGNGAGIGTGLLFNPDNGKGVAKKARLGNITIKGGSLVAKGGSDACGIGAGFCYSNLGCSAEVGVLTVYDSAEMLDASSIGTGVVFMHGDADVTEGKDDYFTIARNGDRWTIAPKDDTPYAVSVAGDVANGTVKADKETAKLGEIVTLSAAPAEGYKFSSFIVKNNGATVVVDGATFVMPRGNVTVSAVFVPVSAVLNEATGVLTLRGDVVVSEVRAFSCQRDENLGVYPAPILVDSKVKSIVCEPGTVLPADCAYLFSDLTHVELIDLRNADYSRIKRIDYMFGKLPKLRTIVVNDSWPSNEFKNADWVFDSCESLVGGNGTKSESGKVDGPFAVIDGKDGKPGYLTLKKPSVLIAAPVAASDLVFSGSEQVGIKGGEGYELSGVTAATNAGDFEAIATPQEGYSWNDGTTEAKSIKWRIAQKPIAISGATVVGRSYAAGSKDVEVSEVMFDDGVDLKKGEDYTATGAMADDAAGAGKVVTVTVKLKNKNYSLESATTTTKVDIAKAELKVAAPTGRSLTYNGTMQDGVPSGAGYVLSGMTKAANVGNYSATATLASDANRVFVWSDGSTAAKTVKWEIAKAANTLAASGKTASVAYAKVAKKDQKLARAKVIALSKAQGTLRYKKASGNKKILVNKKTGKVTVKKGLKAGTYKVKVDITAGGSGNYTDSTKRVVFTVKVTSGKRSVVKSAAPGKLRAAAF